MRCYNLICVSVVLENYPQKTLSGGYSLRTNELRNAADGQ